jgi:hypothetical protein
MTAAATLASLLAAAATRETVRQALADWNAATDAQRAAASGAAARAADAAGGYDRNGAFDGFQVVSDAEGGL